jgi:colanic acid biosynthesis glycosyl transferase WcaI
VLEASGGGIAIDPADARAMADAIRELLDKPERRAEMGVAGRRYIEEHHSRAAIAARLEELLGEVTHASPPAAPAQAE